MPLPTFEKKRIVITGASGFIGTALAKRLRKLDCEIRLVSRHGHNEPTFGDEVARFRSVCADLTRAGSWEEILSGADFLFHLSAQTNLYYAEEHPQQDELANVLPVRRLVDSAAHLEQSGLRVVLASTTTIVGNEHENPVDETFADNPISNYDRHKRAAEQLLAEAVAGDILRGCSLRLSNVYGYGIASKNSNRGILNSMIKRASRGKPLSVYGKGEHIRDFIHIDDVINAFCLAASSKQTDTGRYFIIASEQGCSLREAFEMISYEAESVLGCNVPVIMIPEPDGLHPIEKRNFVGNSALFRRATGWQARISLRDGIRCDFARFVMKDGVQHGSS